MGSAGKELPQFLLLWPLWLLGLGLLGFLNPELLEEFQFLFLRIGEGTEFGVDI